MEKKGRDGEFGGQYAAETLMNALINLEEAFNKYKDDEDFNRELNYYHKQYTGRPSILYYAEKMTKDLGGAKIYLKREDLNHTGAHKMLAREEDGQEKSHCRNRCGTAWCCNCDICGCFGT